MILYLQSIPTIEKRNGTDTDILSNDARNAEISKCYSFGSRNRDKIGIFHEHCIHGLVQVITTCVALGCVDWQVQVTAGGSTGPGAWSTTVGIPRVAASSLAPRACAWQVHSALAVANRPVIYRFTLDGM
jgi:hypothetical protein